LGNEVYSILDSDTQISVLSEEIFKKLVSQRLTLEIPAQTAVLISTFGNRSQHLKKQVFSEISISKLAFEKCF
jgi:hypothetical protein